MDELLGDDPRVLGGYRLEGRLGSGGQGVVYLGRDTAGDAVAVKVLNLGSVTDPQALRRFAAEVDHVRQVSSFCVAEVRDVELTGERPYIVSEYVAGRTLHAVVAEQGPFRDGQLRRLAVGTMTALAAIHAAGIVHRDFKPQNVILGTDGPRVIDFGIARGPDGQLTATGGIIGTPYYMAPEQLEGRGIGPATDLFAWASTVAFAASGSHLFASETTMQAMYAIANLQPELPAMPGDLAAVVRDCLAKDPAERPTAREALLRLIGDSGETTAPATGVPGDVTLPDTSPGPVRPPVDAPPLTEYQTSAPPRSRRLVVAAGGAAVLLAAGAGAFVLLSDGGGDPAKIAAAPAPGAEIYRQDFNAQPDWDGYRFVPDGPGEQRSTHGYEPERGDFALYSGPTEADRRNLVLSTFPAKDAAFEPDLMFGVLANVRVVKGDAEVGLVCRWNEDEGSGYGFVLAHEGAVRAVRYDQGATRVLARGTTSGFDQGETVRLQARCRQDASGMHLTFWVNGKQAVAATDAPPLPEAAVNQLGLTTIVPDASADGTITVGFDDFTVHRPDA